MTTQSLSAPKTPEWVSLIKSNRTKYLGAVIASLAFILITLILPAPWQLISALLGLSLLTYVAVRPLAAYFIYDWGESKEFDVLANLGQLDQANCVVEITCGLSRGTRGMYPHFKGNQYYAFNIYNEERTPYTSLQQALDHDGGVPKLAKVFPRKAAPGRLPLPDGFANVVYIDFALHELKDEADRDAILTEIHRLLHPSDGRLLIAEHTRTWPNLLLLGQRSLNFITANSWREHFAKANLQIEAHRRWRGVVNLWRLKRA